MVEKWVVIVVVILSVPVVIMGGLLGLGLLTSGGGSTGGGGGSGSQTGQSEQIFDPLSLTTNYTVAEGPTLTMNGYAREGAVCYSNFTLALEAGRLLRSVHFRLNWTDEPDKSVAMVPVENNPDEFRMNVAWTTGNVDQEAQDISSWGWGKNNHGQSGQANIELEITHTIKAVQRGEGDWTVDLSVISGDYGEDKPLYPSYEDNGNDYTLKIETQVYEPKEF